MTTAIVTDSGAEPLRPKGAWLRLSSQITEALPVIAGREDLVATIMPGAGRGHPACFIPSLASVEIDGDNLEVRPRTARPLMLNDRDRYPATWGAICHEAAHANHSKWVSELPDIRHPMFKNWVGAAVLLEEIRIESRHVRRRYADRRWLRSCAMKFIISKMRENGAGNSVARGALLALGRSDADVLDPKDVADIETAIAKEAGTFKLEKMREIWLEVCDVGDEDAAAMLDLGKRWHELTGDTDSEAAESIINQEMPGSSGDSPPGDKSSGSTPDGEDGESGGGEAESVMSAVKALVGEVQEQDEEKAKSDGDGGIIVSLKGADSRRPNERDTVLKVRLARDLRKLFFREHITTRVPSELPPGRISMRSAMAREAQLSAGRVPTAKPFRQTRRREDPVPPLRVGVMLDDSVSMGCMENILQQIGYVVQEAVNIQPDSRSDTVMFGTGTRWPRRLVTIPSVVTSRAVDFTEKFSSTLREIDANLGLSRPGNARLLIVVSDGVFSPEENMKAAAEVRRLIASGCRVIWLDCTVMHSPAATRAKGVKGVMFKRIPFDNMPVAVKMALDAITEMMTAKRN